MLDADVQRAAAQQALVAQQVHVLQLQEAASLVRGHQDVAQKAVVHNRAEDQRAAEHQAAAQEMVVQQ